MKKRLLKLGLIGLSTTLLTGCWSIGPGKVSMDRLDYTAAVGNSWKEQMLLNLVKLRYGDVPVFLDVQSMIAQYTLSGTVSLNGGLNHHSVANTPWTWLGSISGNTQYTDRPTITYAPLAGSKFSRSMMTPLPPSSIVSLLQSGYPARMTLRLAVNSINGLQNIFALQAKGAPPDADYFRLLDIIADLQRGDVIGLQVKPMPQGDPLVTLKLNPTDDPALRDKSDEFRQLLGLEAGASEFPVVYGARPTKKNEIAILSRSMLDVLSDLSGYVEVPPKDLKEKRALPSQPAQQVGGRPLNPLLRVHSKGDDDDTFVDVEYYGQKFWLDNRDII